jgi:hypothetical protein
MTHGLASSLAIPSDRRGHGGAGGAARLPGECQLVNRARGTCAPPTWPQRATCLPHAHCPTHCCVHVHDVVVKKNTPLHSSKQGAKECLLCRPVCASCGSGPASLPPTAPLTPWILERDPPLSRMDRVLRAACVCVLPIEGHRDAPPQHSPLSPNRTVATTTLARHN